MSSSALCGSVKPTPQPSLITHQGKLADFDADVHAVFDAANLPEPLNAAARYAMTGNGKRVRPLLAMAAFEVVTDQLGAPADNASARDMLRRACLALELLHGYSLVHDDLPCMDDDALRRGRPTCHVVYGEDVALLVGDALQSLAFEVLVMALPTFAPSDHDVLGKLLSIFAPRARRMVAGQMMDITGENRSLDQLTLEAIHKDKTGALIQAAVLMGGVCANADTRTLKHLDCYAKNLGLAYQVQDDVLDVVADTQTLGKPAGSDDKLQKSTYVKLMGIDDATRYTESLYAQALSAVSALTPRTHADNALIACANWLKNRQK